MEVRRLKITNFRGISKAEIHFHKHTLLIGGNNVGKSTICEALDLVLGPERLARHPVIDEHDFHENRYLDEEGIPIEISIEALITGLSVETERRFRGHIEFWDLKASALVDGQYGPEATDADDVIPALRVAFRGWYDADEDEFRGETSFAHPEPPEGQDPPRFGKEYKRMWGFLYLRAMRTGARALSLERGSLLDVILRLKDETRTQMWEKTLQTLRGLTPAIHDIDQLKHILGSNSRRSINPSKHATFPPGLS